MLCGILERCSYMPQGSRRQKMQGRPSLQVSEGPTALLTPEPRTSGLQSYQTACPRGFPGVPYFLPASPVTPCTASLLKAGLNLRNLRRAELPAGPPEVSVDPHFSPALRGDRISIRESRVGCGCRGPQGTPSWLLWSNGTVTSQKPFTLETAGMYVHTCAHTCTHMRVHSLTHVHMCMLKHVCTLTHVCTHTYMHTHTRSHSSEKGVRPHTGWGGRLVH